jgi:ParB-like nuclease domain
VKTAKKSSTAIEAAKLEGLLTCAATRGSFSRVAERRPGPFQLVDVGDVVIDRTNSARSPNTFTDQLREKSRLRRGQQERLAKAKTMRPQRNDILPRLELSDIWIDDLRPLPRKVRKLDPAHVREVASSISVLGFCVPLFVGRDSEIINGEVSYKAAKQLGLDRLPCVRIGHLSPEEQRVLRLAVNRLAEKGEWDLDGLKIEFERTDPAGRVDRDR